MNLIELRDAIHANAVAKGWWDTDRPWGEIRILIVSEIAEALEEYRAGRMAIRYEVPSGTVQMDFSGPPAKPEGFPVELADAAIRILDYAGRKGWELGVGGGTAVNGIPEQLDDVVACLYEANGHHSGSPSDEACEMALTSLFVIAEAQGIDLLAAMRLKHAYNLTRPPRHGGKRA